MIRKKGKKKKRIVAAVLLGIVLYAAIMGIAFGMIRAAGKRSLRGNSETARPGMMPVKAGGIDTGRGTAVAGGLGKVPGKSLCLQ